VGSAIMTMAAMMFEMMTRFMMSSGILVMLFGMKLDMFLVFSVLLVFLVFLMFLVFLVMSLLLEFVNWFGLCAAHLLVHQSRMTGDGTSCRESGSTHTLQAARFDEHTGLVLVRMHGDITCTMFHMTEMMLLLGTVTIVLTSFKLTAHADSTLANFGGNSDTATAMFVNIITSTVNLAMM